MATFSNILFYDVTPVGEFSVTAGNFSTWTGPAMPSGSATITDNGVGVDGAALDSGSWGSETATADVQVPAGTSTGSLVSARFVWTLRDTVTNETFELVWFEVETGGASGSYTLSEIPLVAGRSYETVNFEGTPNAGAGDPVFSYADYDSAAFAALTSISSVDGTSGADSIDTGFIDLDGDILGSGADTILAGAGNDTIVLDAGDDWIDAGSGDDFVDAATTSVGNATLLGGAGNDTLQHAVSTDRVDGGTGDDRIVNVGYTNSASPTTITGGDGDDTYVLDTSEGGIFSSSHVVDLGAGEVTFNGNTRDLLSEIENVEIVGSGAGAIGDASDNVITGIGDFGNNLQGGSGQDSIFGGGGNDSISGDAGDDRLDGGSGGDFIDGGAGRDTLSGGQGADTLVATGGGNNRFFGGSGNDSLVAGTADDVLYGDRIFIDPAEYASVGASPIEIIVVNGADAPIELWWIDELGVPQFYSTISAGQGVNQPTFENHNWLIRDENGNDLQLVQASGNDTITYGAEGLDDTITGDDGSWSTIYAGYGEDSILGGASRDVVFGESGNDSIEGGAGEDVLDGGSGDDRIDAGAGNDSLRGGLGNDTLFAGAGNDTLSGGDGSDSLGAGAGDATIDGGVGDDFIEIDANDGTVVIDGGSGTDELDFDVSASDTTGADATFTSNGAGDFAFGPSGASGTFSGIETLSGSQLADSFDAGADGSGLTIRAQSGNDTVIGGTGADSLEGGADNDLLSGGAGADTIRAGDGADTILVENNAGNDLIFGGEGGNDADTLDFSAVTDDIDIRVRSSEHGDATIDGNVSTYREIESVILGQGDDQVSFGVNSGVGLDVDGQAGNDTLLGSSFDDTFVGGTGDDRVFANSGADLIEGGTGQDYLDGGSSDDTLSGGLGDDTLLGALGNDSLSAGDGDDSLRGGTGDDTVSGGTGSDTLIGEDGNDSLDGDEGDDTVEGGDGNDTLSGSDGRDMLYGGDGADILYGGNNSDHLVGDAGNDTLFAQNGADTIFAGQGDDSVDGGGNADVIVVENNFGADTLTGGETGNDYDVVDLSALSTGVDGSYDGRESGTITDGTDTLIFSEIEGVTLTNFDDTMIGSDFGDTISGGAGDDYIEGGAGDDLLRTGLGQDTLIGGIGNDTLMNSDGDDSLDGGAGNDSIVATGGDDTLRGGSGDDTLDGGADNDVLIGGAGDDSMEGGTGDDTFIDSGPGSDEISDIVLSIGGTSRNGVNPEYEVYADGVLIFTGEVTWAQDGTSSFDPNAAGAFQDVSVPLPGGAPDLVEVRFINDTVPGDNGSSGDRNLNLDSITVGDTTFEAESDATISGGGSAGAQEVNLFNQGSAATFDTSSASPAASSDTMEGGDGSDRFVFGDNFGDDSVTGGEGGTDFDTIDLSQLTGPVTVTYDSAGAEAGTITNGTNTITFSEIERIITTDQDDSIDGSASQDGLIGDAAGINVDARGGDDTVAGGRGADTVEGGTGADVIEGNYGDDILSGGAGADTIYGDDSTGSGSAQGNDLLEGGAGNDLLDGGFQGDTLAGGEGTDTLKGGAGDDTLYSGNSDGSGDSTGTDQLFGGGGNDVMVGDSSLDYMEGGDGNDTMSGGDGADQLYGGAGDDSIDAGDGDDVLIRGNDGDDNIDLGAGDDQAQGNDGSDTISGGTGNDTIGAGNDADVVEGGAGNDVLGGESGNDTLTGGTGNDSLSGGGGDDTFVYTPGDGADTITDFNTGNSGALGDGDTTNNDFIDLSSYYDSLTELRDDFEDDGALNQSNSTDNGGAVDYSDNTRFGPADSLTFQGANRSDLTADNTGVVCFTTGTMILTPEGDIPVEQLQSGDLVVTRDNGPQALLWSGHRHLTSAELAAAPHLLPIEIAQGAFGNDRRLIVSPQHGVLLDLDGEQVLTRATHLARIRGGGVRQRKGCRQVTYWHLLFEDHQVIFSNGVASESFFPGPQALRALPGDVRRELAELFPGLESIKTRDAVRRLYGTPARVYSRSKMLPDHLKAFTLV